MDFSNFYSSDAPYVKIYSTEHILYLLFCFVVMFLFVRNHHSVRIHKDRIAWCFLGVLLFQQIFLLYGWYALVSAGIRCVLE